MQNYPDPEAQVLLDAGDEWTTLGELIADPSTQVIAGYTDMVEKWEQFAVTESEQAIMDAVNGKPLRSRQQTLLQERLKTAEGKSNGESFIGDYTDVAEVNTEGPNSVPDIETISYSDLMGTKFEELWQPVEGLITEGLTVLVGGSKLGKSWICMDMAYCVATGTPYWGHKTTSCPVLYLALEDSQRRLQSRNTKLTSLACWDNKLTELPLSGNTALKFLSCGGNRLTKLTLSANTALYQLDCADNALTKLTLPKGSALRNDTLFCSSNLLTGLNLSKNTLLSSLNCSANRLTELDLSKNWNLSVLTCGGNRLTKLDVSKCTALRRLDARDNQLVFIDLTKNTALSESNISLSGNKRSLTAEAGRIFYADLGLDSAKVSSVKGATKSSTFFTASKSGTVTYQYKVRSDMKVKFTLKVTYKKGEISSVTIDKTSYPYTGKAVRPAVTVKSKIAGRTVKLSKGTQYKVYYKNNVIPGTATITVKGTGHFKGTLTKTFRITKVKLKSVTLDKTTWTYTGSEIKPGVTVKAKVNGQTVTLEKGVDYSVKYTNNIKKGTAAVTVTGIGNFTGTLTKKFTIQ